jgi:hypothetical protein
MPIPKEQLVREAASFKRDASKEFDRIVKALIDLVWAATTPTADFLFESDPVLDAEANALLRGFSDSLAAIAKRRAEELIRASLEYYDFEDDWRVVDGEGEDETLLWRFDMEGSHLKELLEIWIAIAVLNEISKGELLVLVSRYLNNPYASPLWRGIPKNALRWGRGYSKNILEQISVIGQNAIIAASRHAEWVNERRKGARYYIRRRGSWYDCPECDSLCGYPIPIETPFDYVHSRCMCYPEYHYEPIPNV